MKLTGHYHRHPELAASNLVLWQPNQYLRRGQPKINFVEVLRQDAGNLTTTELHTVMEGRTVWRNHVTARLHGPWQNEKGLYFGKKSGSYSGYQNNPEILETTPTGDIYSTSTFVVN